VVVGFHFLLTSDFYPREDLVACLLVDKIFCFEDNGFADSHFSQGCNCRLSVFVDNKVYWVRNFES